MRKLLAVILGLSIVLSALTGIAIAKSGTLVVIETNDMQSAITPFKARIGGHKLMVGGLSRVATAIKATRALYGNSVIVVSGGDDLMGPLYYYYHGKPEYLGMSLAGYDAAVPGNHEFDLGPNTYAKALKYAKFPVICTNIEINDPFLLGKIRKYLIKNFGGLKVGFFGLITPDLPYISNAGDAIKVNKNLVEVARNAVSTLKKAGADVVIAFTHIGLSEDIKLAKRVRGITLICGGHSHDLTKKPYIVNGPGGWKTVIIQAGARLKYAGRLYMPVKDGEAIIEKIKWEVILLDKTVGEDKELNAFLAPYVKGLEKRLSEKIGVSTVDLDARKSTVRSRESNLGDFLADAMRWRFNGDIAITNGGGIRGDRIYPAGPISYKTLISIHPFGNTAVIFRMKGKDILKLLEISASALVDKNYDPAKRTPTGGFLQISGIRVVYDLSKPPTIFTGRRISKWGSRVKSIEVLKNGKWMPLDPEATYKVITNSWLAQGGDKYFIFKKYKGYNTTVTLPDIMRDYIKHLGGKISPKTDGRIKIIK